MAQDAARDDRLLDEGEQTHPHVASGAAQDIEIEGSLHQARPRPLSEVGSMPLIAFSAHRRMLEARLHTGWIASISANKSIGIGDCTKGC